MDADGAGAGGPLAGIRVLEVAGIGPGPFCAMMLSDMGAEVVRLERTSAAPRAVAPAAEVLNRGRTTVALDLKDPADAGTALALAGLADVLLEGYRPGVMERLGLGPEACLARNPRLVYARMTGWGQDGPMAPLAGHDINYFAMTGALWLCGREGEVPQPNLNMVADMGGGGMMMAFGIACALLEARASGRGQVIDAAMTEGTSLLAAMIHGFRAGGAWARTRGASLLDGGAPFYRCYAASDGGFVAVGSIEPRFYAALLDGLGLDPAALPDQMDRAAWPAMHDRLAAAFAARTRDEWTVVFAGRDACVTPVLTPEEAMAHPHAVARRAFGIVAGVPQPMPAPRFSRTPGRVAGPPADAPASAAAVLDAWAAGPPG